MSEETEEVRTLVIERVFPHAQGKLWRALTESRLLAEWLLRNDFEAVAGRRFQFRQEPMPQWDGVIQGEVLTVEPMQRLSYRWSALGVDTVVTFTLTPAGGGTHLRMEQSGFRADNQRAFAGAKYGWERFLDNLEGLLSGGPQ